LGKGPVLEVRKGGIWIGDNRTSFRGDSIGFGNSLNYSFNLIIKSGVNYISIISSKALLGRGKYGELACNNTSNSPA
jgi:hypothetical protein